MRTPQPISSYTLRGTPFNRATEFTELHSILCPKQNQRAGETSPSPSLKSSFIAIAGHAKTHHHRRHHHHRKK
jgi:hypothetical protein